MKPKKGALDAALIGKPSYVTNGDPYKPVKDRVMRTSDPAGHTKAGHDVVFKPAKVVRDKPYKAPYEHMNDRVEYKKIIRDEDGHVITAPRNFYTVKPKEGKVGKLTYFNQLPAAIPDDYEWPKKVFRKELEEKKKLEQEKPFSQRAKTWGGFNNVKSVFGEDPLVPKRAGK